MFSWYKVPIQWDGRYKGSDLPSGAYYYIINLDNDHKRLTGWVALIR